MKTIFVTVLIIFSSCICLAYTPNFNGKIEVLNLYSPTLQVNESSEDENENNESTKAVEEKTPDSLKKEVRRFVRAFGMVFENSTERSDRLKYEDSIKKNDVRLKTKYYAIDKRNFNTKDLDVKGDSIYLKQRLDKEVFGFHPYWSKKDQDDYNYRVLTALAYFTYELDPVTGNYLDIYDWETSPVIDKALQSGTDVYLTVANFGYRSNRTFLTNLYARQRSIDSIDALLNRREAHGVVIDFENVSKDLDSSYTNYIKDLSKRLKATGKKIAITLPGNYTSAFQIPELNEHVNYFIVMGKNYFYKVGEPAGPVAPLDENSEYGKKGLRQSISDYLLAKVPRDKFILSLPFYGFEWETESDTLYSKSTSLDRLTYNEIQDKYGDIEFKYDNLSQSAYHIYTNEEGKHVQVWYDDARTLEKKFQLINVYNLAGTGIWALSFGSKDKSLWKVLDSEFSGGWQPVLPFEVNTEQLTWFSVFRNLGFLKGLLILGAIVFTLGCFLSLRDGQIRAIVFQNSILKNIVLFGFPLWISALVYLYTDQDKLLWAVVTFICILIGYALYYILIRAERDLKNLNRIP